MRVEKWGDTLAVRLPADVVRALGLQDGDEVALRADGKGLAIARRRPAEEVLASLREFRGRLQAAERLSRAEANER